MELTNEEMKKVITENLKNIAMQIYDMSVAKTVNDRVGEVETSKSIVEKLIKAEKVKNEYEKILKELEK